MWADLKTAAYNGTLLAVKALIACAFVAVVGWFVRDYVTVRTKAGHGQEAYEYLVQMEQARKGTPPAPAQKKESTDGQTETR